MARISEADLQRLKEETSVQRLVEGGGVDLKRQGKDLAGRCPFHADDTASLVVTPAKNLWHCFGCGLGGGPIDWVMKSQGVSFRHAAELLREGLPLAAVAGPGERAVSPNPAGGQRLPVKSSPVKHSSVKKLPAPVAQDADEREALAQVVDYYHATLKQSPDALAYLKARGLDHPELIDTFRLGYANRTLGLRLPDKTRLAGEQVRSRLQKVGIYRESGHEHFNGSLVVPVFDQAGAVSEIYGRKLLDNLRAGTPKHLYLPGPHAGVWNEAALAASREVILCEALIDAMTFWCAGFRNVTASYGTQGFTEDHLAAFKRHGVQRVLIAYDRDDAGERAAQDLAPKLQAAGLGVWRIVLPKGMDANEYALKVTPAGKSLGLLIRKAEWLGHGAAPVRGLVPQVLAVPHEEAVPCDLQESAAQGTPHPLAAEAAQSVAPLPAVALPVASLPVVQLPAAAVPDAPQEVVAQVSEQEVVLHLGQGADMRRWRVRGLSKNLAVGVLKLNVMVAQENAFHVDTLDLYGAKARAVFVQQAAAELRVTEGVLKKELGQVLLKLEALQDVGIQKALAPQEPELPEMSQAEHAAALALLKTPDLLERILADFEACGIVGEATNKLTAYLAATSRKLERPLAVVVQSSSAAGKSSLMDAVLSFMPPEETVRYSAMSGQSLFYMGQSNLKHKVLAIAEEEGAARASYALKLLQSDGELTMASTGTDDSGNLIAQEYRVEGPMSLFMTTTAIDVDEELMNRCLVLSVDEGREQTAAIHRRQRERRTLAGLLGQERKAAILALHRNAQRLLKPLVVVNPYADQLTFLDDRTRTRRDHEKYLCLIDAVAVLHQHQRPVKRVTVAGRVVEYIEATREDIETANGIAHEVLGRCLDELPPQTRKLLILVRDWVLAQAQSQGVRRGEVRFSRKDVRAATGWGDTQLKIHLGRLAELEYLLVHRAREGQGHVYELLYDGSAELHDAGPGAGAGTEPGTGPGTAPRGQRVAHLAGLIDPSRLEGGQARHEIHHEARHEVHRETGDAYDAQRSGVNGAQSAPGRGSVGAQSGAGRGEETAARPMPVRLGAELASTAPFLREPPLQAGRSYAQAVVPVGSAQAPVVVAVGA